MKVLILTGRFGMGHVSAAKALQEQILGEYEDVAAEVVDLVEYTVPWASRLIYGAFGFLARHGKSLYNFIYKQAGKRDENEWTAFTALSMAKLTELMEDKRPDVVISTLPLCSLLVSKYKERQEKKTGETSGLILATCITDISSHSEWIQPNTDFYLAGGELVKRQLMRKGVSGEKIMVTGIPVAQAFLKEDGREMDQGTEREGKRLLIMGGGLGLLPRSPQFYEKINAIEGVKITVITGRNEKLLRFLQGRYENIEAVGYTAQVASYMKQADVVITKPGGITLFETIFSGKPVLLFAPSLQQEVNNMHFALYNNIGRVLPREQNRWAEQICRFMEDEQSFAAMSRSVIRLRGQYRRDGLRQILSRPQAVLQKSGSQRGFI